EELDEEFRVVLQRLLVKRVQHRMAGAIGRRARALRDTLTEMRRHAAERTLIDAALLGARERHAVVLELDDRSGRLLAHVLDRVLVPEPVGALHGVVHVPAPIVLAHVAERGADPALRRDRMAARREYFTNRRGGQPLLRETERRAQTSAAGADDNHVERMIEEGVFVTHGAGASAIFRIADGLAIATAT